MKFFKAVLALAAAGYAAANTVDMVSQDNIGRTIKFVPQEGSPELPELRLEGGETVTAEFPKGWIGNWYTVRDGDESDGNGMLGEIRFDGWGGLNYFDVSAIVKPDDVHNVKIMYPKNAQTPTSGCQTFPCDNAYNNWDDVQTKSSPEKEFVCLIGDLDTVARRHARDMLTKRWA
jgi:hypothetical protein